MAGMRRRPSGETPPLPRENRWTRWIWVLAGVVLAGLTLGLLLHGTGVVQAADQAVLSWLANARVPPLVGAARVAHLLTALAVVLGLRIATVLVLVWYRRFRHLAVFLAILVVTDWVVARLLFVPLPAPGVPVLVDTDRYAFPSRPVTALAVTAYAMLFVLVPRGPVRDACGPGSPGR